MDMEINKTLIKESLESGNSLSDVQKELAEEHNVRLTYLELRMIAAELDIDWEKLEKKAEVEESPEDIPEAVDEEQIDEESEVEEEVAAVSSDEDAEAVSSGNTKVSVNKLIRPGAAISGDVEFSSGAKGEWYVDNLGRLGFNPAEGSSNPTPEDIQEFQVELQKALGY